jgi:hypothetical protein
MYGGVSKLSKMREKNVSRGGAENAERTVVRFVLLAQAVRNGFGVVPSVSDGAVQNVV